MYDFKYHSPKAINEATDTLSETQEPKILAGGQTLLATMKLRLSNPSDLVDLKLIQELREIEITRDYVEIGAMCTHSQVATSTAVRQAIPSLSYLASQIGDQMVRNVGTIGGSVANNDPAADYPAAVLGLGGTVFTNRRAIPGDDFFTGLYETKLESTEIIKSIRFPRPEKSAYAKFKNPASRYAIIGVMLSQKTGKVRLAVTGAGNGVFRLQSFEQALSDDFSIKSLDKLLVPIDDIIGDMHAGPEYRAHLIKVMSQRALEKILTQGT